MKESYDEYKYRLEEFGIEENIHPNSPKKKVKTRRDIVEELTQYIDELTDSYVLNSTGGYVRIETIVERLNKVLEK